MKFSLLRLEDGVKIMVYLYSLLKLYFSVVLSGGDFIYLI